MQCNDVAGNEWINESMNQWMSCTHVLLIKERLTWTIFSKI